MFTPYMYIYGKYISYPPSLKWQEMRKSRQRKPFAESTQTKEPKKLDTKKKKKETKLYASFLPRPPRGGDIAPAVVA